MSRLRKALFAVLSTILVFALAEAGLRLFAATSSWDGRLDPLPAHPDYTVLCDFGDLLRLCPDRGPAYERVRPIVFSRKKERPRIVAIGESFVYGLGLPVDQTWPARLEAALGSKAEVLNFGRCGTYASRLVPLVDAAIDLDADAVVLAVGNNEHTMTSFYTGWAGRHPLTVYRLGETLGRLQIFGLLWRIVGIPPRVEESFEAKPLHFSAKLDRQVYAARRRPPDLSAFARQDLPEGIALAGPEVTAILEDEQRLKERIFRGELDRMIQVLQDAGITVVLATLPRDLTVPPVLSGDHRASEADVVSMLKRLESGSPDPDALIAQALALDPTVSFFQYKAGMRQRDLRQLGQAGRALRQAVDWDMVPDATPAINAITVSLGQRHGVPVVDLDHFADRWLLDPSGFFLDKVHVNAEGAEAVAQQIAPVVQQQLSRRKAD